MVRTEAVHVDVRNIVIPLWLGVSITFGFCGIVATGLLAYVDMGRKVDQLLTNQAQNWTKTDQQLWCYEAEKANSGRFVCPGSIQPAPKIVRVVPVKPAQ